MGWGALFFFVGPRLRAHLLTTCKRMVVLPAAAMRSPRAGPPDVLSLPSITGQQTPPAACASDGTGAMHLGAWGPSTTNKLYRIYTGALLARYPGTPVLDFPVLDLIALKRYNISEVRCQYRFL